MKPSELRDLTDEELAVKLNDARTELFNLRFRLATGQLNNPVGIREIRRRIARIHTIMRERELEEKGA